MKIIKLFVLLSLGLWAEFKLDIPNDIDTEQLQYIIENGWNDKNETLNKFIIKYGEKTLPDALGKMQKTLVEVSPTKDNPAPVPTTLLYRDDYKLIFSYLKYLEFIGESNKAQESYFSALKGFSTINDRSIMSVIYRQVIGKIAVDSLDQAIRSKRFSLSQIREIKNVAEHYLLQDNKILWSAFEYEIEVSDQLLRRGLQLDITEQEKSNLIRIAEINYRLKVDFYKRCWALGTIEKQEKFIQTMKQERETFFEKHQKEISEFQLLTWDYIGSQYAKSWKDRKGSSKEDKEFVKSISNANDLKQNNVNVEVGAKWLFYASVMPEMYIQFKRDIDEQVHRNIVFIKSLEQ